MLQGRETALSHLFSSKSDVLSKRKINSLHLEIDHHWQQSLATTYTDHWLKQLSFQVNGQLV